MGSDHYGEQADRIDQLRCDLCGHAAPRPRDRSSHTIVCVDTGYFFPETYQFAEELTKRLALDVRFYSAQMSPARQEALYGKLWEQGRKAWSAISRSTRSSPCKGQFASSAPRLGWPACDPRQTEHRAGLRRIDRQDSRLKLHPILHWTAEQMIAYMERHDLPTSDGRARVPVDW